MESNTLVESAIADPASFATSAPDTGLLCLVMLARFHGIATEPDQLAHEFGERGQPFSNTDILLAAKKLALKAKLVSTTLPRLTQTPSPCMALLRNGHYVILARADENQILIQDPLVGRPQVVPPDEFTERWSGKLILFTSRASLAGELRKFDFSWFIPAVVKYRKLLLEVLSQSGVTAVCLGHADVLSGGDG